MLAFVLPYVEPMTCKVMSYSCEHTDSEYDGTESFELAIAVSTGFTTKLESNCVLSVELIQLSVIPVM